MALQKINTIELVETTFKEIRKHRSGGFFGDVDLNRLIRSAELTLLEHYVSMYEENQIIVDHLQPFLKYGVLLEGNNNGIVQFPTDYAHKIAHEAVRIKNPVAPSTNATIERYECFYLGSNEVSTMRRDPIAGPSLDENRYYLFFANDVINMLPETKLWLNLTYIRYPVYGTVKYKMEIIGGKDVLNYDTDLSTNMEWNMITFMPFQLLLMEYFGVAIKDQYVAQYGNLPKIKMV